MWIHLQYLKCHEHFFFFTIWLPFATLGGILKEHYFNARSALILNPLSTMTWSEGSKRSRSPESLTIWMSELLIVLVFGNNFWKHSGNVALIWRLDGQITKTDNYFDNNFFQVIEICDTLPLEIWNRKASSSCKRLRA